MGSETRNYRANKRQIINYNNLISEIGEAQLVCVDKGVLSIARKLVSTRGLWRTTYATDYDDNFYHIPDDAEFRVIEDAIGEFLEAINPMNCNDLITELSDIAAAIRETACCPGIGAAGAGATDVQGTDAQDDGSTYFPAGYADRDEYTTAKCEFAEDIRLNLITDLTYIKNGTIVTLAASALIGALITPIPGDEILAFAGFVASLLVQGLIVSTAQGVIDELTNNAAAWRCAIYEAETLDDAKDEAIATLSLTTLEDALLGYMLPNYAWNNLFDYSGDVPNHGVSCNDCVCDFVLALGSGTILTDDTSFVVSSELFAGYYKIDLQLVPFPCLCSTWRIELVSYTGSPASGFGIYSCPGDVRLINQLTPVINYWDGIWRVDQTATAPFTFTFKIRPRP